MPTDVDLTLTVEENGTPRPLTPDDFSDTASELTDGRVTIDVPGTPQRLTEDDIPCQWVCVTALKSNTDQVSVGSETVVAVEGSETGSPLDAKEFVTLPVVNVNLIYLDATVAGEGATWIAGS